MQPLEVDIINWFLKKNSDIRSELDRQIASAVIGPAEFTGTGAIIEFKVAESALPIGNGISERLTYLFIESPELKAGAEVELDIEKGYVDYIEIWAYAGYYPRDRHVKSYTLKDLREL